MNTHNEHCRAVVSAYYMPPTNTKPSRIKVRSQRGFKTYPWNHDKSGVEVFNEAVAAYLASILAVDRAAYGPEAKGWGSLSDYSVGQLDGGAYVYVSNV